MAIEVFNRFENKFLIDRSAMERIEPVLSRFAELDDYNTIKEFYTICNIYYDTPDNHLIRTSLSKPVYKEKLRLRGYEIPEIDSKVYLEIKKKFRGKVNKRRTSLELHEAYDFVETGIKPGYRNYMNRQVLNEIEYFLSFYDVMPQLYLAYDRRAYFGSEHHDLRITFDRAIRTRRYDLKLDAGDYGDLLLDEDQIVMEVKTAGSIPYEVSDLLSRLKIFKRSFSKYGREYMRTLAYTQGHREELQYA